MGWQASAYVKDLEACPDGARLNRGQKLLALILADYHNSHKRSAWPSIPRLALEAMTSHSQAKRDLAYLEEHLLIRKLRPEKMGRGWVCGYEFMKLDAQEELERALSERAKGVHHGPLFCAEKSSSEVAHSSHENGSEVAQKGFTVRSAIRKNEEQEQENKERGVRDHARALLEKIELPLVPRNEEAVRESIKAVMRHRGVPMEEASTFLTECALEARLSNQPVNEFWFQDAKWNHAAPTGGPCPLHPDSGITSHGGCYGCYAAKYSNAS